MQLTFNLLDWQARAPGLNSADEWQAWSAQPAHLDPEQPLAKCSQLPMMAARRLTEGSRAAVDCALALVRRQSVDAVVFTSRHGELERNLRILNALAQRQPPSPTDFTMSVHNAAVGSLTIAAAAPLVSTSLSAGNDSFQQGLLEVAALHAAGYRQVLLVDFEGAIPDVYRPHVSDRTLHQPYAVALLLTPGEGCRCAVAPAVHAGQPAWPQSLQFLHAWLAGEATFSIAGERVSWQWVCRYG